MASKKTSPLASLNFHSPWDEKTDPIWPCSSFNLRRNIEGYLFPHKLTKARAQKLLKALQTSLLSASELQNPYYVSSESLSLEEKHTLFEHFLWKKPLRGSDLRYGFVLEDTSRFIAQLNLQDHLKLQLINVDGMWAEAWNLLEQIEGHVQETLPFAFNSDYGYITSDLLQSGCALEVIAYLHLPALLRSPRWSDCLAALKKKTYTSLRPFYF